MRAAEGSLVFVHFMRFARRAEDVPSSRKVFLRARNWAPCTWQVQCSVGLAV